MLGLPGAVMNTLSSIVDPEHGTNTHHETVMDTWSALEMETNLREVLSFKIMERRRPPFSLLKVPTNAFKLGCRRISKGTGGLVFIDS